MTPKALKNLMLSLTVVCFGFNLTAQCDSENVNSQLLISFDNCASNTLNGTNVDYSEFTATTPNGGVCNNLSLAGGFLYRNNPTVNTHSCTPGVNDTPGMCVGYDTSCDYTPGADEAVRFDVVVQPINGSTTLSSLSFYELSPAVFQYLGGSNGLNNRPLFYAVRVLVGGVEVFHEIDIPTTQEWSVENFDFSNNPAFTVSGQTTFNFELTAYCQDYVGGAVAVWDLDELTVNTTCSTSTVDLNADISIAGGQTSTSCNGTTFNFVTGANPAGSVCTWYFNWPSTDPSTVVVGPNPTYTFPVEGIYTIRKEVSFGDCFEASELTVSAFNNGVVGNGVNGTTDGFDVDVTGCNGSTVNLNLVSTAVDLNAGFDVNSWNWTITVNGVAQVATGPTVALALNNTDNVSVSLLASSTSGCQNTFIENFNVGSLFPTSSFVVSILECTANGYILSIADNTNLAGFTLDSYAWELIVDGQAVNPGNVPSFTIETVSEIVSITHGVNFTNGCSAITVGQSINVLDLVPTFSISIVDDGMGGGADDCGEQLVQVTATGGSINGNITSVDWVVSVGGQTFTFTGNPVNLDGIITEAAVVTATINYDNGCSFTASQTFIPDNFPGGSGNVDVTFNGNPVIDCENDVTPLLLNPNPNYTYTWSPMTGLTFTDMVNFSDPVVSVTETTVYSLTVTDGACVLNTSITVIPESEAAPVIGVDGDGANGNEFCSGVVSVFIVDPIPGVQYEWSCGSDFTTIVGVGTTLVYDAGSFTTKEMCARIAGANAACDIFACATVINNSDILQPEFNGNPVIDCNGDVTPVLLNGNPNFNYQWDPTIGLTFTDMVNFSDPTVSVTEVTTYSVTVTDGDCSYEDMITVIPEDLAIPEFDLLGLGVNEDIFCNGLIEIDIINAIPGVEYEWTCEGNVIGTGTSLSYDAGEFGEKEICAQIATMADCDISSCITVFDGQPDLTYENPLTLCPGDTIQYEIINNTTDDIVIVFEDDDHIVEFDENGLPVIGVGENEDEFGIPFTVTNEFCTLFDTLVVMPGMNEDLSFTWELEECGEFTLCFDAGNIDPDTGVPFWDFGDESTDADTSNVFNPCYTYPDIGFYNVTLMDFSDQCPGIEVTMEVEVSAEPTVTIESDTINFEENPVIVTATTSEDPEDIVWCDMNGDSIGSGPMITYTADSLDFLTAKITDEFGCSDTSSVVLIMGGPFTDIDGIDGPQEAVCANDTFQLDLVVENPGDYTYSWGPSECVVSGGDTPSVIATVQEADKEFEVIVTHIASMTDSVYTFGVTVGNVDVVLECDFEDGIINWGSEGTISVTSPEGTYVWSNGETGSSITVSPTEDTEYSVTVTDANGCTGVASKMVTVNPVNCTEDGVFITNAFSPNGDGANDVFRLRSDDWVESVEVFIVYNRWGEEIYNANGNVNGEWDGTFDGEILPPDAFGYCIKGVCIDGQEFTRVGNVTLVK